MLNGLSNDVLSLQCYHHSERSPGAKEANGDLLLIPVHGSYNWSFHPVVDKIKTYYCDAKWGVKGGRGGVKVSQNYNGMCECEKFGHI
ncbi:hypothetical protein V2J09_022143 [Rumex salicifolius]